MPTELKMPALSPTMEKGTLVKWLVEEGDVVRIGDVLAEIETDKASMEMEAVDEGRITTLLIAAGSDDVPVGTVIALMGDRTDDTPIRQAAASAPPPPAAPPTRLDSADGTEPSTPATPPVPAAAHPLLGENDNASPLAKAIAAAKHIDLSGVTGSGPQGRILKADLIPAGLDQSGAASPPVPVVRSLKPDHAESPAPPEGVPVETVKLSTMQKTIARRLVESKQTIPHFYLTARCNAAALMDLRLELNASLAARGVKLSVNDMLIKAMAMALIEVPDANVQFGGDMLHRFSRADISMAVAVDNGLVTPVLRDVNSLSLSALSRSAAALAQRARGGTLSPLDYQGGTASISNLGMFGVDEMIPVINPPQALILGIAAAIEQPWNVNGEIALAPVIAVTGSFDHRAINGATAAAFMNSFRTLVETPLKIMG